jgi:methyl-accepting chemotaxis protein
VRFGICSSHDETTREAERNFELTAQEIQFLRPVQMNIFSRAIPTGVGLSLRAQIQVLGMAGVAVVGVIYLVGLQFENRSQRIAEEFGMLASLTAKVSEGLLQGRELATEFLQKPSEKKIADHNEIVGAAAAHLATIERVAEALPDNDPIRKASTFRSAINNYTTRFSNVASAQKLIGLNENDGLQGKLRSAVHSVEGQLKKYDQPRLAVLMLMMRRHEKDFMLRGDEKYGDELRKRAEEFSVELAKADLPATTKAEITKLIESYQASFLAFMAGQSTLTEEAADLTQIYDRLRPTLMTVRSAADQRHERVKAELASVRWYVLWSICLTVLAVTVLAFLFGRRLSVPLLKMVTAMERLSQGDLDSQVERVERRDEIGKISRALSIFRDKLLENRELTAEQAKVQERAALERRKAMLEIADGFERTIGKIVGTVVTASSEIEAAAGSLAKTAEVTQELTITVATASEQSSANVQSAAAATEQMVASVAEIGRQVHQSQQISSSAVAQAEQTNMRIAELSRSAGRISDVVKMISEVAEQTNLLALNATIEAARAGEAGRGFAVVASEVKALASQTAKATDEIGAQIAQMQSATESSVSAIQEIGETIGKISEVSSAIAGAVEEQGAATQEIARNVQQANQGAGQVEGSIAEVNRGASQTGSAAGQVHSAASALRNESDQLKKAVEQFLATVRAA